MPRVFTGLASGDPAFPISLTPRRTPMKTGRVQQSQAGFSYRRGRWMVLAEMSIHMRNSSALLTIRRPGAPDGQALGPVSRQR